MNWQVIIFDVFTYALLIYAALLMAVYVLTGVFSISETRNYRRKNSFTDYRLMACSTEAPSLSVLAPAYNEGATIIENVRSLLSLNYMNVEVIIINDGSQDDSLEKLIAAYDLHPFDFFVDPKIITQPVKTVYKSHNPVYKKLIVVDKIKGGKADALNVGINISKNDFLISIDVDCVLEQDALLKLCKPFLEQTDKRVIATGGVLRIVNSCDIEGGRLVKINLPEQFLPRVQTLEYIRAFLLSRMAWARLNGLLLISGAFGAFDKDIVIRCGGYDNKTVGEDMELVVRMRRYMEENKQPYRVCFIPDPLCWTEAPATYKNLGRQRNRWTRGTIETLHTHRKMFFNPKYHLLGLLSYPYWLFFEFLAPIIETVGFIMFILFCTIGMVTWSCFYIMASIFSVGVMYSIFAILMEVTTYNQYKRKMDILRLVLVAIAEPVFFHPFVVMSAIKGNFDLLRKRNAWGEMTRQGFARRKKTKSNHGK
jgi:cellulose synthase/poly-beta-1,6-N-acetylglucosamine synthase-like glycosyltransferase